MSKARITEIASIIQASPATEARLMVELLGLLVENSREAIVRAGPTDIFRLQGQAQAYEHILKTLTVLSPVRKV